MSPPSDRVWIGAGEEKKEKSTRESWRSAPFNRRLSSFEQDVADGGMEAREDDGASVNFSVDQD